MPIETWEMRAQAILPSEPSGMTAADFGAIVGKSKQSAGSLLGKLAAYGLIKRTPPDHKGDFARYYAPPRNGAGS